MVPSCDSLLGVWIPAGAFVKSESWVHDEQINTPLSSPLLSPSVLGLIFPQELCPLWCSGHLLCVWKGIITVEMSSYQQ